MSDYNLDGLPVSKARFLSGKMTDEEKQLLRDHDAAEKRKFDRRFRRGCCCHD